MKAQIVKNGNGQNLVVTIETQTPTLSASGKTLVAASTRGNVPTEVAIAGKPVIVGLNAYISAGNRPFAQTGDKTAKVENGQLVITVPMQAPTLSKSGKTMVVASTRGNVVTDAQINGKNVVIGLNAYFQK